MLIVIRGARLSEILQLPGLVFTGFAILPWELFLHTARETETEGSGECFHQGIPVSQG